MPRIRIDDERALTALSRLAERAVDQRPAWEAIGENLVATTKRRFQTGTAPDGSAWAANTDTTVARFLGAFSTSFTKTGNVSKAGRDRAAAKRPLIGETRQLSTQIVKAAWSQGVDVGSPMEYAPTQQFGAQKGEFGTMANGMPIPWGDIPARRFLGLSAQDGGMAEDTVADFLAQF